MEKIKWGFNQNLSSFFKMHKLLLSSDQIQQNYTEKNHVIYTSLPEDITHWTHTQNDV